MIKEILEANQKRLKDIDSPFNPITGEGSIGERVKVSIFDAPLPEAYLPKAMLKNKMIREIVKLGSIADYIERNDLPLSAYEPIADMIDRIRCLHDFPYWAFEYVMIKPKTTKDKHGNIIAGGEDLHFKLNRPQRRLVSLFEEMRTNNKPIRVIILKARQWGGSTVTQIYMAWLQLVVQKGLNSIIIGHLANSSAEVRGMFDKLISYYPQRMLYNIGATINPKEPKMVGDPNSVNIKQIPSRNCKIKVGSAETPQSARGGDAALAHLTEVGLWKTTDGKKPEDIVRSAVSGIAFAPSTMVVYESTANGTGNFFQREYDAAKQHISQFAPLFVAWWQIEQYSLPFKEECEREKFAQWLYDNRENRNTLSDREEPPVYLWDLFQKGATLEALHWYIEERKAHPDHADMASEYPSDDIEAFQHSGARVFDPYLVSKFRPSCKKPLYVGDVYGESEKGKDSLSNIRFAEDKQGMLWVWELPDLAEKVANRYLVVVDIGGRSSKADWSVICVIDRYWMIDGDVPVIVAQWYGHIDMDLLAWKAAQIASYYDNALLVIESNTLETKDRDRYVDGDQSVFILNQIKEAYDNLYARKQSEEDIKEKAPIKYGFHTNIQTKPMVISTLIECVRERLYVERDARCLDELLTYERKQNGSFGAIIGKHDDLLMTRAIGLYICFKEMERPFLISKERSNTFIQKSTF